jgi:hypothetical protein
VNMHWISNILKSEYLLALELEFALGVMWKSIYDIRHC